MSKKILVIDDEKSIIDIIKLKLTKLGYDIETATTGPDGLEKARSLSPDLILLDIMLPGIDGFKICQMLKFDENYKHIPIILLSAKNQESDRELGLKTGANDYLVKESSPKFWDALISKINTYLGES
jgi:CheY-like chemotaxis protein